MDEELKELLQRAKARYDSMTPDEKAYETLLQRRSWVVGEMMLEHADMTQEAAHALYARLPEGWALREIERCRNAQPEAWRWAQHAFGPDAAGDKLLRALLFIEEAIELVQACGLDDVDVHKMTDIVYDRPRGAVRSEVGGVMLTLMVLSTTQDVRAFDALVDEQRRVWTPEIIAKVRARQATKPQPTRPEAET